MVHAFGDPGITPAWQSARKTGVGTAYGGRSKVWFTLAKGIVTEVYYPRVDVANVRDLQFLVSDGQTFVHEEQRDLRSEVRPLKSGIPAYEIVSVDRSGRYRLTKRIITDSDADALVMQAALEALQGQTRDYALYLLLNPQISTSPWSGLSPRPMTATWPWPRIWPCPKGLDRSPSSQIRGDRCFSEASDRFIVVLGFGSKVDEAVATALATVARPYAEMETAYVTGWRRYLESLDLERLSRASEDEGRLLRTSAMVLAVHEDKTHRGAHVASLSIPWGERTEAAEAGGYHLVWPRDLYHIATARLALGDAAAANRALAFRGAIQRPDGSWAQNTWVDGTSYWTGLQLDEVAFPILLAWRLRRAQALDGIDPWLLVRAAALFIARNGPVTPQERWEENAGYSPSTLAVATAALVCAAEFARSAGEESLARYFLEVADSWAARIEGWTFTRCGALLPGHPEYYERIASLRPEDLDRGGTECRVFLPLRNRPGGTQISQCCLVDASFLDLVRYGVRSADDSHVLKTLSVVDALLKVDTPCGPAWRRYNGDGFGDHEDGAPYDGRGVGRAWPLLTGERAHYEIAAGRGIGDLVRALECFANPNGLLPEQVWDAPDVPERELFMGRGTGAATPLAWAHAEYVKLLRSRADGHILDGIEPAYERYVRRAVRSNLVICKFNHKLRAIRADQRLRLEVYAPAELHWSADERTTVYHEPMREIVPGVWAREFGPGFFSPGRALHFTYYWPQEQRWEGRDFLINVV